MLALVVGALALSTAGPMPVRLAATAGTARVAHTRLHLPDPAPPTRLFAAELNLIFDSKCAVCQWEVDFLRARDSEGRLTYTDCESPDFEENVPRNGNLDYETAYGKPQTPAETLRPH
jgi:hypothetical protein